MEKMYKIKYMCRLRPEASHSDVVQKLSAQFKISKEKSEAFISSKKNRVIKKDLPYESAQKYKNILTKIGLEVKIIEMSDTKSRLSRHEQVVNDNLARQNHQEIKSKKIATKPLSEVEH